MWSSSLPFRLGRALLGEPLGVAYAVERAARTVNPGGLELLASDPCADSFGGDLEAYAGQDAGDVGGTEELALGLLENFCRRGSTS